MNNRHRNVETKAQMQYEVINGQWSHKTEKFLYKKLLCLVTSLPIQASPKAMDKEIETYSTAFHQYQHAMTSIDHGNASKALMSTCRELELLIQTEDKYPTCHRVGQSRCSLISFPKRTLTSDKILPLEPKSNYAPNSNKEQPDEEMFICNKLSTVYVKFCGVCFREDDGCTDSPYIMWEECVVCNIWMHKKCSIMDQRLLRMLFCGAYSTEPTTFYPWLNINCNRSSCTPQPLSLVFLSRPEHACLTLFPRPMSQNRNNV